MLTGLLWSHPQSSKGAVLFPNFTRRVKGKLYVRENNEYYQTGERQNGAYPIIEEVTPAHPDFRAVETAFLSRTFNADTVPNVERIDHRRQRRAA